MKLRELLQDLETDFFRLFEANIVTIKPILEKATPIEYTYHGLKHAETLEKYADLLIPDDIKKKMSSNEIFILLNGIYYHDIGMIKYRESHFLDEIKISNPELASELETFMKTNKQVNSDLKETKIVMREIHNLLSYQMIYNENDHIYNEKLIKVPNGDVRYAKSIALLCKGHRDYKKDGVEINTIEEIPEKEAYPIKCVNTRFLASIVRIADELDITNQRAPHDVFIHLKYFLNDKSLEEWKNHNLFSMVSINSEFYKILFIPDKDIIRQRDRLNSDRRGLRNVLFSKVKKVELELSKLKSVLQNPSSDLRFYDMTKFRH